jgi:hypothetical protein
MFHGVVVEAVRWMAWKGTEIDGQGERQRSDGRCEVNLELLRRTIPSKEMKAYKTR